jgi:YjbE family integral membrane protein
LDLGIFGHISFDWAFFSALMSIVIIDLILAGDNAVVIAMAVRSLPHDQRKKGIIFGSGAAVLLRVILTFFVAQLLQLNYVKLAGGALILWIAVKLFVEGAPEEKQDRNATTIWQAIRIIVIADITMALDNMLAVGGASHGNMFLLLFGLGLSIPLIVFTSNLLSMLMDKYPVIIYIGAAILGKVGGEMMITDPFTVKLLPSALLTTDQLHPIPLLKYSIEASLAVGVILAGKLWMRMAVSNEGKEAIMTAAEETTPVKEPGPILTISRQYGSGGREIGLAVAQALGYTYVDRDAILDDIRKDGSKWEQWAKDLDEHAPTVWERYDWSYRGFAALLQKHILERARQGGVVLMGRGANFLLKDVAHAYRIRVEAPLETRIERIIRRETMSHDTARWMCERTDRERAVFLHTIYGRRWDDPAEYGRVVTVNGLSVDEPVKEIVAAMSALPVTADSIRMVNLLYAGARVKAGIATNPRFFIPTLDVLPEGSGLILRGVTHTPTEHRSIEDEAKRLAGDIAIRCDLHYRTAAIKH